jgi:hypothetical protein
MEDDVSEDVPVTDVPRVILPGSWGTSQQVNKQVSRRKEKMATKTEEIRKKEENIAMDNIFLPMSKRERN